MSKWQPNGGGIQLKDDALLFNPTPIVAVTWRWRSNKSGVQLEIVQYSKRYNLCIHEKLIIVHRVEVVLSKQIKGINISV